MDYEKLGYFYLGRAWDPAAGRTTGEDLLYDSRDLTTHAVCVGMTGSGKTGLCMALLEEAAIDGIPAIVIDPKGDLGNLMLTFPQLRPADFLPWIDAGDAARKGMTPEAVAEETAASWKKGLAGWGQEPARIARFAGAVERRILTPGSTAGAPVNVLRSLGAPPQALAGDADALRERIANTASGLLALLGIEADPLRSREHVLLSTLLAAAWNEGRGLTISELIRQVQAPPMERVGVLDLETVFPAKDRASFALALNNLLAAPGFAAWMEGEPLDAATLLHAPDGRPRLTILSIAHLSDAERMFFVTALLNEVLGWMRTQPGTSSLRALLYMDEVFGFFPPVANPPSKIPMLTLLKQARAFGLGIVLASQNPVDLDYKGLSNAGTWFLGRLQTERDKARVLEGLEGAASAGRFDRHQMEAQLSGLGNRVFLMQNVHEDGPVLFQTRWLLSYLRGPLTRAQIQSLSAAAQASPDAKTAAAPVTTDAKTAAAPARSDARTGPARPVVPAEAAEVFLAPARAGVVAAWVPALVGEARVHYVAAKAGVDTWQDVTLLVPLPEAGDPDWAAGRELPARPTLTPGPAAEARFASLPSSATRAASYALWRTGLARGLYQSRPLALFECRELKQVARPGEGEGEFRARLGLILRERRDQELERLKQRSAPKLAAVQEQVRRAAERVERERSQAQQQTMQTAISVGATVLGALFGRKAVSAGTLGRATTAMRGAGRTLREREDVGRAEADLEAAQARLRDLEASVEADTAGLPATGQASGLAVEPLPVAPRKADIAVVRLSLAWLPVDAAGAPLV